MVVFTYLGITGSELFVTTCVVVVGIFLYKEKRKHRKKIEIMDNLKKKVNNMRYPYNEYKISCAYKKER